MAPNPDISRVRGVHFVYDQGLYHLGFEVGHYISLERACPVVSRDMIRRVLRQLKKDGRVECLGRGPGALWRKKR